MFLAYVYLFFKNLTLWFLPAVFVVMARLTVLFRAQCPYNVVLEYISRIPDPSGFDHDHKNGLLSPGDPHYSPPLPFFRAVTTRGSDRPLPSFGGKFNAPIDWKGQFKTS